MKRNIIYTIMVAVSILLSACGSNSKTDPVEPIQPPATNGFSFENATSSLLIDSYDSHKIEFQLTKDGFPAPAQTVSFKVFNEIYGSVSTYNAITDENGKGAFLYNPPAIMPDSDTSYDVQFAYIPAADGNGTFDQLSQNVTLNFNYDSANGNGRATTLSLVYVSTSSSPGKMINRYLVHAVDKKSNQPKIGIPVTMSLVNNVKVNETTGNSNGKIVKTLPVSFRDQSVDFVQKKVEINDNLIIFPSEDKVDPAYLGGWNVDNVGSNLTLSGTYSNLVSTNNLYYVVGDERRLIGGEDGPGQFGVADVILVDDETDTDENGDIFFDVTFDPILAGHTVTLEAHGTDNGERIGIAKRAGLRWGDFSASPESVTVSNTGNIDTVSMNLSINTDGGGSEWLVGVDIVPSSFTVTPESNCTIITSEPPSDFTTGNNGQVTIAVTSDGNATNPIDCEVKWTSGMSSIYLEY